jgi:hypothetical protein
MYRFKRLAIVAPILALVGCFALPAATQAASWHPVPVLLHPSDAQGNLLPEQPYFEISARAGSTVTLDAFVGNKGKKQAGIMLVPVDARSGLYGAVSYNLPEQPKKKVGSWVRLSHAWVSLGANRGMVVPFSVHVPAGTKPGQYVGALTAYVPAPITRITRGIGLREQFRVFNAIVVTVPGSTQARLTVHSVVMKLRSNDDYLIVNIKNSGNVLLKAEGHLWLYGQHDSKPWVSAPLSIDTTVPGTAVHYPVPWTHHVPRGAYRYSVRVSWLGGSASTGAVTDQIHWKSGIATVHGVISVH